MLLEALVAYTCYNGMCDQALDAYYVYNPSLKQEVDFFKQKVDKEARVYLENEVCRYTLPVLAFLRNKSASIDLGNKKTLSISYSDSVFIGFTINF